MGIMPKNPRTIVEYEITVLGDEKEKVLADLIKEFEKEKAAAEKITKGVTWKAANAFLPRIGYPAFSLQIDCEKKGEGLLSVKYYSSLPIGQGAFDTAIVKALEEFDDIKIDRIDGVNKVVVYEED